jgi:hypothetical protein
MKWLNDEELNDLLDRGFKTSEAFDTEEHALLFAKELKQINKDPSFMVSIGGLYAHLDHYPQVVYKHTFIG